MLLALQMILAIAVLTLPVRSVISNDLGERYTEGLGYAFWETNGKEGDEKREEKESSTATSKNSSEIVNFQHQTHFQ